MKIEEIEVEKALIEEVQKVKLEFAELSLTIRELLGKIYVRGGIDALNKVKNDQHIE